MTRRLYAAVLLLPALAACSSNAAPAAQPTAAAVTTATTTAAPPATTTTTANPNAAADRAMCTQFDAGTKDLAALVAQIATGAFTPTTPPAITIGKADIAMRAATAKAPSTSRTAQNITALAGDIEALGKKIAAPDANGVVHTGTELAAVQTDWKHVTADCNDAGYTLTNTIK